ncbi:hypothetical protein N9V65_04180 [Flavobacteriales bacterium]|jgi:hypothetical protein|nr:hypothetical protein [Flavobacteriales bacterium]
MSKYVLSILCVGLLFTACEKTDIIGVEIVSNDAFELRSELQEDGYIETISDSIVKEECYFEEWDKTVLTPVSGLIDFHDENDNWIASIDFGDGECDEWATKTWDINVFTEDTSGTSTFSVFEFKSKKE